MVFSQLKCQQERRVASCCQVFVGFGAVSCRASAPVLEIAEPLQNHCGTVAEGLRD